MPGFVAAVQTSITVPIGLTHLYYICFLSGFAISAGVYCFLHFVFPAKMSQGFVKDGSSPAYLQRDYQERWDGVGTETLDFDNKS